MRSFLLRLQKLSESSSLARYAYSYVGRQTAPSKHFSDNCKHFANEIERSLNVATSYQKTVLKSVARHVKNQNLTLAQDIIDKLDYGTKSLIPNVVLSFISRNS